MSVSKAVNYLLLFITEIWEPWWMVLEAPGPGAPVALAMLWWSPRIITWTSLGSSSVDRDTRMLPDPDTGWDFQQILLVTALQVTLKFIFEKSSDLSLYSVCYVRNVKSLTTISVKWYRDRYNHHLFISSLERRLQSFPFSTISLDCKIKYLQDLCSHLIASGDVILQLIRPKWSLIVLFH